MVVYGRVYGRVYATSKSAVQSLHGRMIKGMWLVARLGRQVYSVRNPEKKERWGLVSRDSKIDLTKRESDETRRDDNESLGSCHFFPPADSAAFFSRAIQNKHTVRKRSQPRSFFLPWE